jgi:hypothetical protein
MFSADRDLVVLEPSLLQRFGWAGQRRFGGSVTMSGTALTLPSGQSFAALGLGVGSTLLIDGVVVVEIVAISAPGVATVSLMRATGSDAAISPGLSGAAQATAWSFSPQRRLAHEQVMGLLGLLPMGETQGAGGGAAGAVRMLEAGMIVNPRAVGRVEALLALRLIFGAQGPGRGHDAQMDRSLGLISARLEESLRALRVLLDSDGDGVADVVRAAGMWSIGASGVTPGPGGGSGGGGGAGVGRLERS